MLCTEKKTLDLIVKTRNHYVVCMKQNRGKVYNQIVSCCDKGACIDEYSKSEKNRGRIESRVVSTYEVSEELKQLYPHCKRIIKVNRSRVVKGKESNVTLYYISDLELTAEGFYEGIRGHWSIENSLHWVKDVVMLEDKSNMRNKLIAPILSLFRSFIIMIARYFLYGVTNFQRMYAHDIDIITLF